MEIDLALNLFERSEGPMSLRLILQPAMAIGFAIRDGMQSARLGQEPHLWAILFNPEERRDRVVHAWKSAGKVVIAAFVLDCIYQAITGASVNLINAALIAIVLAVVPYTLVRGPANRFYARRLKRKAATQGADPTSGDGPTR